MSGSSFSRFLKFSAGLFGGDFVSGREDKKGL